MRALRGPLGIAGGVATVSVGLLWLALAQDWLGADVGRGDTFCEAARDQLVRQPANTWSNAGFVVAGLLIAWHLTPATARSAGSRAVLTRPVGTAYAVLVVLLGPGSAAMHASQSALGGHLDTTSMYLLASFAAAYAGTRYLDLGGPAFPTLFVGLLLVCELVGSWSQEIPVVMFAGNVVFGVLLLTALVLEFRMRNRPGRTIVLRWGAAALGAMLVAFVIWNGARQGTRFCDPESLLQGHAVWHLLGAVGAYCLFRLYASERVAVTPAREARVSA